LLSQLAASRHDANVFGAGVIAACYLIRMAADSDRRIGGLRWASPIGWLEELRPLTGSRPVGFVPIVILIAVTTTIALLIARQRDLGASALGSRDKPRPRTFLLGGQAGLTLRLTWHAVVGWLAALAT